MRPGRRLGLPAPAGWLAHRRRLRQNVEVLYQIHDPHLVIGLLNGEGGFHGPAVVLDGLSEDAAQAKVPGLPHSIAEIVAHMCFWQEWFNRCAQHGFHPLPEHAAEGWPAVPAGGWDELRSRYLASLDEAKQILATAQGLDQPLLPPGVEIPFLGKESRGSGLLHAVVHNGHHLGQIVTMRQLLGRWPPAAGPMTW